MPHTDQLPTTTDPTIDDKTINEEFAGRLFGMFTGGAITYLIDIGYQTGLFTAADGGPATSAELASRAGLDERYVREWLGAMATSGIFEYDAANATFWLPQEHAVCLTGSGIENLAPLAFFTTSLGKHVPAVTEAFQPEAASRTPPFSPRSTTRWMPSGDPSATTS